VQLQEQEQDLAKVVGEGKEREREYGGRWPYINVDIFIKEGTKPERRKWRVSSKNMGFQSVHQGASQSGGDFLRMVPHRLTFHGEVGGEVGT